MSRFLSPLPKTKEKFEELLKIQVEEDEKNHQILDKIIEEQKEKKDE